MKQVLLPVVGAGIVGLMSFGFWKEVVVIDEHDRRIQLEVPVEVPDLDGNLDGDPVINITYNPEEIDLLKIPSLPKPQTPHSPSVLFDLQLRNSVLKDHRSSDLAGA